jgi:hypothetical protein
LAETELINSIEPFSSEPDVDTNRAVEPGGMHNW